MGYDDGFYYGKGKIICLAVKAAQNGRTIAVEGGGNTYSGTMAEGKCEFQVPGKNRYTITLAASNDDPGYTKTIDVSYGECVGVYMADGYDLVTQDELTSALATLQNTLQTNFQGGVDSIYNAVKSKGTTPASKSLSDVVAGINNIGCKNLKLVKDNIELKKEASPYETAVSCTGVSGYQNMTADDFVIIVKKIQVQFDDVTSSTSAGNTPTITKTYNASTGELKIKFNSRIDYVEGKQHIYCRPTVAVYTL